MINKTVKYINFDGEEIIKNCYFNLTEAEITEMEFGGEGNTSFTYMLRKMTNEKDMSAIVPFIKKIMLASYGQRTADGDFIKNQHLRDVFASSEAYSKIFMELCSNVQNLAAFINGIVPTTYAEQSKNIDAATQKRIEKFIETGNYADLNERATANKPNGGELNVVNNTNPS